MARLRAISGRLPLIRLWSGPQTPSPKGEGFSVRVGFGQWRGSLPPPPAGGTSLAEGGKTPLAPSARGLSPQRLGERAPP